ncbi:MAG: HAMP domain-containing protein, partial [Sedimentisphaerales bacterium]
MRHSLRNRILISVPAIFIVVMLMVTIAIVVVQSKHSRREAERLLRNAFSTIRYTISEKDNDLVNDFGQMISLNDIGGMIKYVTDNRPYFKYSIMRPTYIKITDLIYNTGVIADAFKVGIYDMNGNLIAFSINGEYESTSGYIHNLENIEVAKLKPQEELTYESWRMLDSLPAGVSYNWGKTVPDREITNFEVIDNVLCIAAYIPVMGRDYNPATEKMESRQVGLVVAVQKFDAAFAGKMSELSGTDVHIFSAGEVSVSDCNMHTTFDIGRFADSAGNWSLTDEPVVFDDIDIDSGSYVRAALPVYSGSKCIAVIVVLYSKENARTGAVQIVKLLSIIYFIGIALIVPATVLLVVRGIINPIKNIASMMRQITYKRDFAQVLKTERRDEIGDLAASFNEMTENLRQTTTSIENLNKEIEERQKAESELEEANAELKNFVYIASHDLREPLRKISAFGSMVQKSLSGKIDGDDAENLNFMIDGANRMTKMIEGL